uniref:Uncharacterized protein n=1 Tax=Branchiostoma floridae TaxID=7739 RepID=C3XZU6_BRAFL|eukprot:XP_002610484.1 hypothetical protein BRAFLDRAFT_85625 [Branchiostoma floridae]
MPIRRQVDVGGMLHHLGLTIDTVTTNIMVIAIGLAVDYATHICHTFLIVNGTGRVFFLVLLFRCLHGLVFLPVILSWLGPAPYSTAAARDAEQPDTQYIRKVQTQGFVNPGLEMDGDVRTWVPENRSNVVPCVTSRPEYPPDIPPPDYNVSPGSTIRLSAHTANSVHGHAEATIQWGSRSIVGNVILGLPGSITYKKYHLEHHKTRHIILLST